MGNCNKVEKWLHSNLPVDIQDTVEAAGTTVAKSGQELITIYFLILRVIFALYTTFIACWAFWSMAIKDGAFWNFFTYMTHWGFTINAIYFWLICILHYKIYKKYSENDFSGKYPTIDELGVKKLWDVTMLFLDTGLSLALFIIILYWGLLYTVGDVVDPITYHTHGIVGGMVVIEWMTSLWQLSYRGALTAFLVAFTWACFSVVFYLAGWTNEYDGGRYIYDVIDWGTSPGSAILYCIVVCVAVPTLHVILVAIKNTILKCWLNSRSDEEKSQLIVEKNGDNDASGQTQMENV